MVATANKRRRRGHLPERLLLLLLVVVMDQGRGERVGHHGSSGFPSLSEALSEGVVVDLHLC